MRFGFARSIDAIASGTCPPIASVTAFITAAAEAAGDDVVEGKVLLAAAVVAVAHLVRQAGNDGRGARSRSLRARTSAPAARAWPARYTLVALSLAA